MDWHLAIEKNRAALKSILAMLVATIGFPVGSGASRVDWRAVPTLPRHLHRFVLRLLRPAEAAARRLIIVAARGLVVELAPLRARKPKPQPETIYVLDRLDGSIVSVPMVLPQPPRAPARPQKPDLSLPLFDPHKRWGRRRWIKQASVPHIIFDFDRPREPDPPPPSSNDQLDAGRLNRRLAALASALDDLPRQANRLARWQARRDERLIGRGDEAADLPPCGGDVPQDRGGCDRVLPEETEPSHLESIRRNQRFSPMRPGRPPGWRRRPDHAVYEVLNELHGLAVWARERPNTS